MMRRLRTVAVVGCISLGACHVELGNYAQQRVLAEAGVSEFRRLYNLRDWDHLYGLVAAETPNYPSRSNFGASMDRTYQTLGSFKSADLVASACFPYQVRLVYHSEYEKQQVTEAMTWIVRDGRATSTMHSFWPGYTEAGDDPKTKCTH